LIEAHLADEKNGIKLIYAVPDQPWIDSKDGADVRVAMTVGVAKDDDSTALFAQAPPDARISEDGIEATPLIENVVESIGADLQPEVLGRVKVEPLKANSGICFQGVVPAGDGFKLDPEEASVLSTPFVISSQIIKPYILGRDVTGHRIPKFIIDLFGWDERTVREKLPEIYQLLSDRVRPFRAENARKVYREKWWIFAEPRPAMRKALTQLDRFIVTPYTAKFRCFTFVENTIVPDAMAYAIALSDAYYLGVLSSAAHMSWAIRGGGRMGVGNDPRYISDSVFLPFPFPDCTEDQKQAIRDLAERLDAHRKRQQQLHPSLTLTGMYNVLEKLRVGEEFTEQDHHIYDAGLIGSLRELHDSLDRAVFDAYGWPEALTTEQVLERIVALNAERCAEEASGLIRWLRPEYQAPHYVPVTPTLEGFLDEAPAAARRKQPWPAAIPDQFRVIKDAMRSAAPQTPQQIATGFRPAPRTRVAEILATLTALGQAHESAGRYSL
jgi:hypothetical protein